MMDKNEQLYDAAGRGVVTNIRNLLRADWLGSVAEVNWHNPNYDDYTPLHEAATNGHVEAIRALLQAGAHVGAKNKYNGTPLHLAAENGHAEAVQALLQAGADADAKDLVGYTPLNRAEVYGHEEAVRVLLLAGTAARGATSKEAVAPTDMAGVYALVGQEHKQDVQAIWEALQDTASCPPLYPPVSAPSTHQANWEGLQGATSCPPLYPPASATSTYHTPASRRQPLAPQTSAHHAQLPSPHPVAPQASTSVVPASPSSMVEISTRPMLYTGGLVTLATPLAASQAQGLVAALAGVGLHAAVSVAGAVATCNPVALVAVSMKLLQTVHTLVQKGQFSRERLQRMATRVAALEPALMQLGVELEEPMHRGVPVSVVQSLCGTLVILAHVLVQLQELQQKLLSKGAGVLRRTLELLKAGLCEQQVAALDLELRDCVTQLSAVLNIAHFNQVARVLRGQEGLQVGRWQYQNEVDRARDLQQLEGLVVEAAGGVQALQQQLAEQQMVLDGQVVGLQQVAEWLQRMQAGNALIVGYLQQMGQQLEDLGQQVGDMHMDVAATRDQVAQLVAILVPPRAGQLRRRVPMDSLPDLALPRERIQVARDPNGALTDVKRGAFGGVVQAVWAGHKVAVKVYSYTGLGMRDCRDAVNEAVLLCKANHPNIVHCYGVVYDPDAPAQDSIQGSLVMEWVEGGSLYDWLQDEEQDELGLEGRVLLARRVAEGMRHLAEKRLVHGDLKPQNILMSSVTAPLGDIVPQVKICDFGLSKYTSTTMHSTRNPTKTAYTLAYTSPERLTSFRRTSQDDVYAFGILLFFIATGCTPYSDIPASQLARAIEMGARPDIDAWVAAQGGSRVVREVAEMYCQLAKRCWAAEAGSRPTVEEVLGDLCSMLARLQGSR